MSNEEFEFKVDGVIPEKGKTYPLYGMITKIVSSSDEEIIIIINGIEDNTGIELTLYPQAEKVSEMLELLKGRGFETGIFITEMTEVEPRQKGICKTVVFGRQQSKDVQ